MHNRRRAIALCLAAALATPALAVKTSYFTQTTPADFLAGKSEGVVVTNRGELRLSRDVKLLLPQDKSASIIQAMAEAPDGAIYFGISPDAEVMRFKGGKVESVVKLKAQTLVLSLACDAKGALLIGTGGEQAALIKIDNPAAMTGKTADVGAPDQTNETADPADPSSATPATRPATAPAPTTAASATDEMAGDEPARDGVAGDGAAGDGVAGDGVAGDGVAGDAVKVVWTDPGTSYIWAIVPQTDGSIDIATGTAAGSDAKVYQIDPAGKASVLLETKQDNVLCLIGDGKQTLYAGTDTDGLIYRVDRQKAEGFVVFDTPEGEVSALAFDGTGDLLAATGRSVSGQAAAAGPTGPMGGPEVPPAATVPSVPLESPEPPATPPVPSPAPGDPRPIPQTTPNAPAQTRPGQSHFGAAQTAPSDATDRAAHAPARSPISSLPRDPAPGRLRNEPFGTKAKNAFDAKSKSAGKAQPEPMQVAQADDMAMDAPDQAPGGATAGGDMSDTGDDATGDSGAGNDATGNGETGMPDYPGTGPVPPTTEANEFGAPAGGNAIYRINPQGFVSELFRDEVMIYALATQGDSILAATGESGEVWQINPKTEEQSVIARVDSQQVSGLLKSKAGQIYLGLSNSGNFATVSPGYAGSGTYTSAALDASQTSLFGKLKLDGTLPEGGEILIATRSGNTQDPDNGGWSKWSDDQPAKAYNAIAAPAARFLQYRLTLKSSDTAKSPAVGEVWAAYARPNVAPRVAGVQVTPMQDPNNPGAMTVTWQATDPNEDAMAFTVAARQLPAGVWVTLAKDLAQPQYVWQARESADAQYEVKVTASDAADNVAGEGQTVSRVSDPVMIDHTPPAIGDLKTQMTGTTATITLRAVDRSGVISGIEYSIDSADHWQKALPDDKIADSPEERYTLKLAGLKPAKHAVLIRAVDGSGNQSFESVTVNVPGKAAPATRP